MHEVIFESQLLVVVSLPDVTAADSDIEMASVVDQSDEFISEEELDYYMSLDEK